ncbi:MAG TPA: sigma-54-dependent Fis family transcriptional regulator [Nitrospirae bacterium]|nr:transcriptional regulatory protein ZraR [bacterium BMS3Abin06]HDH10929.1 sigma-54-dependent Fis family transcriptional regulator [Nitrospirota bacterium]HDZ00423.1 sigma-54-dependent Fis family transcriptional regulator [Nitrospirota bacterium]
MHRILVIDDEESIRELLADFLESKGLDVVSASDGESGLNLLKGEKFDLFLLDLMMPGMSGLDVLRETANENINMPSIVITAYASVQTAVEAMKLGAFDYITKPFNLEELYISVKRALDVSRLQKENFRLKKELKRKFGYNKIIGNSSRIQDVIKFIEKIADTDSTVLVTGESGTGKELVAKTIHYNSLRAKKPFVPLNCAAIPKDILESELFGHEKGAFTGAINTRIGRFELANQGTLFLDEIGELAPSLQVKLLRVLQEREFERVGGIKTIKVDVRIIAATNKDLEKAVKEGTFREDLFYRLNVIPLHLPPLRKMKEDVPLLIEHFNAEISRRKKKEPPKMSEETMNCLLNYRWPGNVRELENLIERIIILKEGDIVTPDDLPDRLREKRPAQKIQAGEHVLTTEGVDLNIMLDEIENNMILQALEISRGVKSKAANLLGLNRTTLIEKMKKKAIEYSAAQK